MNQETATELGSHRRWEPSDHQGYYGRPVRSLHTGTAKRGPAVDGMDWPTDRTLSMVKFFPFSLSPHLFNSWFHRAELGLQCDWGGREGTWECLWDPAERAVC